MFALENNFVLHQRYTILNTIAQGGFGITYAAVDAKTGRRMCIKELFISGASSRAADKSVVSIPLGDVKFDDFVQKFIQEAKQLAKFNHPSIVRVTDFFQENKTAYMVMNFVEGSTLKYLVGKSGPMSFEQTKSIIFQLIDALEIIHSKNMLHRDIKPDNIIITPQNQAVLLDFGAARDYTDNKTIAQTAIITPGFAPLEQYNSSSRKGKFTDIYAFGATLYFLLTGLKPLDATQRIDTVLKAPHEINPKISSQISSIIMLAMQMKPENRFQDVAEIRQAFNLILNKEQIAQTVTPQKTVMSNEEIGKWVLIAIIIIFFIIKLLMKLC